MSVFYKRLVVPAAYAGAGAPDVDLSGTNFQPKRIQIVNEDGTLANDAFISFDGVADVGHVTGDPGVLSAEITYNNCAGVTKLWFKKGGGVAPTIRVLIEM